MDTNPSQQNQAAQTHGLPGVETLLPVQEVDGGLVVGERVGPRGLLQTAYHSGKRAIESAIMFVEVTPLNESLRYAAFAASQVVCGGAVSGGVALGGANLAIEGLAAVAAADWVSNKPEQSRIKDGWMRRVLDWTESKVEKVVPKEGKMNKAMEAGIAFLGGTAVLVWAKDRQEPTGSRREKGLYGLRWAGIMSGVVGVQGALGGDALHSPAPKTIGLALLAFGGAPAIANKLKNRKNGVQSE